MEKFNQELIKVLVSRLNHLETVLFSSALGFLLTTTVAVYSAVYSIRNSDKIEIKPNFIISGVNIIYVLLSGYYYFILTHFYATASIIIPFKSELPDSINIERLWTFFQLSIPFIESSTRNYLSLLNAPLFPLLFSVASTTGVWYILRNDFDSNKKRIGILVVSFLTQMITFFLMIWYPFSKFIKLIEP